MTGPRRSACAGQRWCGDRAQLSARGGRRRVSQDPREGRGRRCALERANAVTATKVDARKLRVAEWCQEFYRADAVTSAPNSRRTSGITLTRFVEVATESDVTWTTPERSAMRRWITTPDVVLPPQLVLWVKHHSLLLSELDAEMLKVIDARLRTRIEGGRLGALTAGRNVKLAKRALDHAVRAGLLTSNQWPTTEDGESDRKVNKQPKPEIVVASLEEAQAVVANLRNHQPRSWTWWLMTILGLYAGLRPQETITLESETSRCLTRATARCTSRPPGMEPRRMGHARRGHRTNEDDATSHSAAHAVRCVLRARVPRIHLSH